MAEFLVKATSHSHPNWFKDKSGAYKRGMIVEVRPNGAKYGRLEGPPKFIVIRVPALPVYMVQHLAEPLLGEVYMSDGSVEEMPIKRRAKILDITDLSHGQTLSPAEFFTRLGDAN